MRLAPCACASEQVTGATNRKELKKVLKKRDASYSELVQRLERVSYGRARAPPPLDTRCVALHCRHPTSSHLGGPPGIVFYFSYCLFPQLPQPTFQPTGFGSSNVHLTWCYGV